MKEELVKYVIKQFKKETGINLSYAYVALNKLHNTADRILTELEAYEKAVINIPFIYTDRNGPIHLHMEIPRGWNSEESEDIDEIIFKKTRIHKSNENHQALIFFVFFVFLILLTVLYFTLFT